MFSKKENPQLTLLKAIADGNLEKVKEIVSNQKTLAKLDFKKINPETTNKDTILTLAAKRGNPAIVQKLLEGKVYYINQSKENGFTPLYIAAQRGNLEVVKVLLTQGANPDLAIPDGFTSLSVASEKGHLEVVKELLNKGAKVDGATNWGDTPLMLAASRGHLKVVRELLKRKASPNLRSVRGANALSYAKSNGHSEIVRELILNGASLYPPDEQEMVLAKEPTISSQSALKGHPSLMSKYSTLKISHNSKNGEIILTANSCKELKAEVDSIIEWSKSRNETPNELTFPCEEGPEKKSLDIKKFIPKEIQQIYGILPSCDGPNCFNTALLDAKLLSHPRLTGEYEWNLNLRKNCRKRASCEAPRPGDLVSIRERMSSDLYQELHGFTYIGKLACSKNGLTKKAACLLQPIEEVLDLYGVSKFDMCVNPSFPIPEMCKVFYSFYDCSSNAGDQFSSPYREADVTLSSCTMPNQNVINSTNISKLLETVNVLLEQNPPNNENERAALFSYIMQIEFIKKSHCAQQP